MDHGWGSRQSHISNLPSQASVSGGTYSEDFLSKAEACRGLVGIQEKLRAAERGGCMAGLSSNTQTALGVLTFAGIKNLWPLHSPFIWGIWNSLCGAAKVVILAWQTSDFLLGYHVILPTLRLPTLNSRKQVLSTSWLWHVLKSFVMISPPGKSSPWRRVF